MPGCAKFHPSGSKLVCPVPPLVWCAGPGFFQNYRGLGGIISPRRDLGWQPRKNVNTVQNNLGAGFCGPAFVFMETQELLHKGWQAMLEFKALGRTWRLERAASMEALWEAMSDFADADERLPYWAELWPSSLALAEWLHAHAPLLRGKRCLDIGCGIGYTALVGSGLGARVAAMDYEAQALHFARQNALLNGVAQPDWLLMDWRKPALRKHSIQVAWAGDVMYERRFAEPLADFLDHVLAVDGLAWIAEPSRAVYAFFVQTVNLRGFSMLPVCEQAVMPLVRQAVPAQIKLWQITRTPD